jgi:hypothetical protein
MAVSVTQQLNPGQFTMLGMQKQQQLLQRQRAGRGSAGRPLAAGPRRLPAVRVRADNCMIVNTKGGGHAFIGLYLAKALLAQGHSVTIMQDGDQVGSLSSADVSRAGGWSATSGPRLQQRTRRAAVGPVDVCSLLSLCGVMHASVCSSSSIARSYSLRINSALGHVPAVEHRYPAELDRDPGHMHFHECFS